MSLPDAERGLTPEEVVAARRAHGWNELPTAETPSHLRVFLRQFSSFLVLILILAAVVAGAMGELVDAATIAIVVLLNAVLGFVQEWRAETALSALRALMAPQALVLRDGQEEMIPARDVVPGDILLLAQGDRIAADALLRKGVELSVDESILTGESVAVAKDDTAERSQVYAGTSVVAGHAEAIVSATGPATEFGKIARLTGEVAPKVTNLQRKLGQLARQLGLAAIGVAASLSLLGIAMGRDPMEMVMTGLSLSVAMVPEGLPAVVTITLALGATAMVRQKALARRLQAVETLGAASVICSDKTGTLTENKMTVTRVWTAERQYQVTGTGHDPAGHIETAGTRVRAADDAVLADLLRTGMTCGHARLSRDGSDWTMTGTPTEGALVTLAYKGWCDLPESTGLRAEVPFTSGRKRMSVLYHSPQGLEVLMKGAPEAVLPLCTRIATADGPRPLSPRQAADVSAAYHDLAAHGLRVIALARKPASEARIDETDLIFLGLVGLIDPPRDEVRAAIAAARAAGIRIVMVTGDSPVTARAIADQLGLPPTKVVTGPQMEAMDDAGFAALLKGDVLFARTRPEQKMRLVATLQAAGHIVAMTGDGVNDAPALKQADIGVSMGIRGTDVARDASDLVLLDDNFATIVRAIAEGRRQFANVRKFVRYLLSSNAGEVIALTVNILIGGPIIFLATQILWMNLVTDGVTAVALGLEKAEPDQMEHPPRRRDTPILGWAGVLSILCLGLYTGLASLWIFLTLLDQGEALARTAAFTAMIVFEKISVFAFRSLHLPGTRIGWLSNPFLLAALAVTLGAQVAAIYWPPLQTLLHTVPIGAAEWQLIALFALPILVVPEVLKTLTAHRTA